MEAALKALADDSRRTMLEVLAEGPVTAGELAALLPIARPGVSRHLRVLREAGLVDVRPQAQRRVYSLRPQPLAEINDWLSRYLTLWDQRLDALHTEVARGKREPKEHLMTTDTPASVRTLATLRAADGTGIVRLQDRFDTDVDDLWSALTDPRRLARWLGEVDGELREGGEFRARFFASGWEGTCRVQECEPPRRLLLSTRSEGEREGVLEASLTADGDHTILVIEDRCVPLTQLAAYGAGNQVHLEDLTAYLAGRGPCDARVRWQELQAAYQQLAAGIG